MNNKHDEVTNPWWMLPPAASAKWLYKTLRRSYRCPWCGSSYIPTKGDGDTWCKLPLSSSGPKWICEACAIEVYIACSAEEFEGQLDQRKVESIAREEGMNTVEFRKRCLEHQITLIDEEELLREEAGYRSLRAHLVRVLKSLGGDEPPSPPAAPC